MPTEIARRVVVHGRVQGVFFRDSLRRVAAGHGVTGWARNRDDGTVEAQLEGGADAVERVIEFCRQGPPRASVERVEVSDTAPCGTRQFAVR